jgi:Fe-S cluster assembly protein SufD
VLKDGAHLEHYRLQRESKKLFTSRRLRRAGRASRYDTTSINLGAQLSRHDISVVMDHEGAETSVDGLYMVGSDQHSDTHSVIDHKQPTATVDSYTKAFSTATPRGFQRQGLRS